MTDKKSDDGKRDEQAVRETVEEQAQGAEGQANAETPAEPGEAPDLQAQLEEAQAQAAEYLDGWQRARAELANFRKRNERERSQWQIELRAEAIESLLPVLDDFDRAMDNLSDDIREHDWVSGIALIYRKFQTQLNELGVREIPAAGEMFDPELHDAMMSREEPDTESGTIIEVLRKGYTLNERVIRPALVAVAS